MEEEARRVRTKVREGTRTSPLNLQLVSQRREEFPLSRIVPLCIVRASLLMSDVVMKQYGVRLATTLLTSSPSILLTTVFDLLFVFSLYFAFILFLFLFAFHLHWLTRNGQVPRERERERETERERERETERERDQRKKKEKEQEQS